LIGDLVVKSRLNLFVAALLWLGLASGARLLGADEKAGYQGLAEFKGVILTNENLALCGVDVVTLASGKTYLLALGTTANQAASDPSVRAKLDTRKVGEAKARKAAAEFLKVEVRTEERLEEVRKTEKVSTEAGLKSRTTKLVKLREEIITTKSEAALGASRTVATWLEDDGKSFSAVVAFEVPRKQP
jgi:hypothetical protein